MMVIVFIVEIVPSQRIVPTKLEMYDDQTALGSVTRDLDRQMFINVKRRKETLGNYLPLNRRTWGVGAVEVTAEKRHTNDCNMQTKSRLTIA